MYFVNIMIVNYICEMVDPGSDKYFVDIMITSYICEMVDPGSVKYFF